MRWLAGWLLLCSACGRLAFDPLSAGDGGADAADAACTFGPFSTPMVLPGPIQSSVDDWVPRSALGTTQLYFCTYNPPSIGFCDIFYATRPDASSTFSAPIHITELATTMYEGGPGVTEDALDMVFYRDGSGYDLLETTRASIADPWGTPQALAIDTPANELSPSLTPDGLRMVFASSRTGGLGANDIWETTRASRTSAWATPVHLTELCTGFDEEAPTISANGLEIFFSSNRAGGLGMHDVYTARRPAVDQPFDAPAVVPELSSARDDIGVTLSADGRTVFLNYDTLTGGGGNADFWVATRTCE